MKYLPLLLLLFTSYSAISQEKIDPITFKRSTGYLAEGADSMTLERVLGCSKFAVTNKIWGAIYSPDGKYIVVGGYNYIACFDQESGERIWGRIVDSFPKYPVGNPIRAIAIHQETNRLVFGGDNGKICVLNFSTGEIERILAEEKGWIMAVALSPNGRFAAASDINGQLNMWDLKTGNEMPLPVISNARGEAVCFSSDGKFLAFGSNNCFYLIDWDNQTYEKYDALSTVQSIVFINNNKEVLISGWKGFVQRVHLESKEILWKYQGDDWLINLKVLPNQTSALVISPFYVLHLDWENDKVTKTNLSVRTAMDLHPDGKTILTAGSFANRIEQFDWKTEKPINNSRFYTEPPMKLVFSPNGKYLAAGSYFTADKGIFWDTKNWNIVGEITGNKLHGFQKFTFTKDSKYFCTTMKQNNARLPIDKSPNYYKVPSFKPVKIGFGKSKPYHHASVNLESIETIHLKKLLPVKTAAFFGTLDDTMNRHLFGGWTIEKVYFSGITNENILYIYDSKTGKKVAGTPLPDFGVVACAIHPEAKIVAVTAWDGLVYIYKW